MSGNTKFNFWFDVTIFVAFIITALTGLLLWLVLPSGPGSSWVIFLGLTRQEWVNLHNWVGLTMLLGVVLHLILHWRWITCIVARYFKRLARQARVNFSLDSLMFVAFFLSGLSGLVAWLILPSGGYRGGRNPFYGLMLFGLGRHDWSDLHLWASLALMAILTVHLFLHLPWLVCAIRRYTQPALSCRADECVTA